MNQLNALSNRVEYYGQKLYNPPSSLLSATVTSPNLAPSRSLHDHVYIAPSYHYRRRVPRLVGISLRLQQHPDLRGTGQSEMGRRAEQLSAPRGPHPQSCRHRAGLRQTGKGRANPVSYTHLRAHETRHDLVCRLLLEKKKKK